jgi:O-antigen ligase
MARRIIGLQLMYRGEPNGIPEAQNLKAANSGLFLMMVIALPFDNALFHFFGTMLFVTVALTLYRTGSAPLKRAYETNHYVLAAFAAILAIMLVSNIVNDQNGEAWRTMLVFIFRYGLIFAALTFLLESQFLTLRYILLACVTAVLIQLLPFLPEIWDGSIFSTRFEGFTSNANVIGLYAGLGVLVGIYFAANRRVAMVPRILVSLILILLASAALLASGNRGGWVALVGALACYAIFQSRRNYKITLPLLALLSLGTTFVFTQFAGPKNRLELLLKGYPALRDEVWTNSYQLFLEKPILGYGLDTRSALLQNHYIYSEHNIFLSALLALGALGLLAYGFLLFTICWPALKNRNAIGLSAMTFLMGCGMFGFDFYRDQHFMVCFVIVSVACLYEDRKI